MNFLFDVDGTLTESRKTIDEGFKRFFAEWVNVQREQGNKTFLVTGSDRDKTVEQIGVSLWRHVDGVYQNAGNVYYEHGKLRFQKLWKPSDELRSSITTLVEKSSWYGTADGNIEERIGMINISTVGRSCNSILRKEYYLWDLGKGERADIAHKLSEQFPELEFVIGGEISIDIFPKGNDKSQVLDQMTGESIFIGDRCEKGGNDYTIAQKSDLHYNVRDWKETHAILTTLLPENS
tara:strand:+ start:6673 stop:7380 length:708 start_codon:yes stop_codon:yes gene_type:complete